eukprot:g47156.t1
MQSLPLLQTMGVGVTEDLQVVKSQQASLFASEASKVIFRSRIHSVLTSALELVIHLNQTYAKPGRKLVESLALIRDAIAYVQDRGMDACLISLDQEKGFDRVLHMYMRHVLSKLGFGEGIHNWIQLLYTNIVNAVSINGWESENFPIRSGVRHGCPLSPALFLCCIEPFAESTRKDVSLRGVAIPGSEGLQVRASLYVDDVAVFCSDLQSVSRLLSIWDQFVLASGSKLSNKHRNIASLVVRRVVPVRSFMHAWILCATARCPQSGCGGAKTVTHHLLECAYAKEVWREMQWFLSTFVLSSSVMQDSVLYSLFPRTHNETNISCAWRTINAVKDALRSAQNLLVFQLKELTMTKCSRLAHSNVQDYVLRDTIKLRQLPPRNSGERPRSMTPAYWVEFHLLLINPSDQRLYTLLNDWIECWSVPNILLCIDYTWHPIYPQKADEQLKQSSRTGEVTKVINEGRAVDIVYMGFSKAYDKVPH